MLLSSLRLAIVFLAVNLFIQAQPFDLVIDRIIPSASNPNRIYALARPNGSTMEGYYPFRSDDAGLNWLPLYVTEQGRPQRVRSLAVPVNADNTVVAALPLADGGVMRSTDAGATWAVANTGLPSGSAAVEELYSGTNPATDLYAKVGNALYYSANFATGPWSKQSDLPAPGGVLAVNLFETGGQRPLTYAAGNRLFTSRDQGRTWGEGTFNPALSATSRITAVYGGMDMHLVAVSDSASPGSFRLFRSNREVDTLALRTTITGWDAADRMFGHRGVSNARIIHLRVTRGNGEQGYCRFNDTAVTSVCLETMGAEPGVPVGVLFMNTVYGATPPGRTGAGGLRYLMISQDGGMSWTQRDGLVRPTLEKPAGPIRIELEPNQTGAVQLPVRFLENPAWRLAVNFSPPSASWATLSITSITAPAQPEVRINTAGLAPGVHEAVIRATAPGSMNGSVEYRIELTVGSSGPRIAEGGVGDAAGAGTRISPGSLFSIYGATLAPGLQVAGDVPLPLQLNGVEVRVNGVRAPILFVSGGQINAQLPYETQPGTANVQVSVNGVVSNSIPVQVFAAAPGLFQSSGRAIVQHIDGSINGPANPAAPSSAVVIYFTGIGTLDNSVATGVAAPNSPLSRSMLETSVRIGNTAVQPLFTGLTPGFVGLAQSNIVIPNLPPGDYPLTITINGVTSNSLLIAIGNPRPQ